MKHYYTSILYSIALVLLVVSCKNENDSPVEPPLAKKIKIAVFTDAHLFDPSLRSTSNQAFINTVAGDRKMLAESDALLRSLVNSLLAEKPDLVLVPGDLTKDGEKQSHQLFAQYMGQLINAGIKVRVIPGNHDCNNPWARSYLGEGYQKIATITQDEFAQIYSNCGYSDAIVRDPNSLSYVSEPYEGLVVFGIDCTRDFTNTNAWVDAQLKTGKYVGKQIIGIMHYGLVEHFTGQAQYFPGYVVNDWQNVTNEFATNGLHIVFTGHFHAQDISKSGSGSSWFYDVETGSLVTYTCPWRIAEYDPNNHTLAINSHKTTSIDYSMGSYTDFQTYARDFFISRINSMYIPNIIKKFNMTPEQAKNYTDLYGYAMSQALLAHFEGDEQPTAETYQLISQCLSSDDNNVKMFGLAIGSLWTDIAPADKSITIDLLTGVAK